MSQSQKVLCLQCQQSPPALGGNMHGIPQGLTLSSRETHALRWGGQGKCGAYKAAHGNVLPSIIHVYEGCFSYGFPASEVGYRQADHSKSLPAHDLFEELVNRTPWETALRDKGAEQSWQMLSIERKSSQSLGVRNQERMARGRHG